MKNIKHVVHGRWDDKYLGSKPEFQKVFDRLYVAQKFFLEQVEKGAGTIFLETWNMDENMQLCCHNVGHRLIRVNV